METKIRDPQLATIYNVQFCDICDGSSDEAPIDQEAVETDCLKLQVRLGTYSEQISDYNFQYGEYDLMPNEEKLIYQYFVQQRNEIIPQYRLSLSQYRRHQIGLYNHHLNQLVENPTYDMPDIADMTTEGHVRFDNRAIQNGKERLESYNYIPQVRLIEREAIVDLYESQLFNKLVEDALELAEERRLCSAVIDQAVQKSDRPKSILKNAMKIVNIEQKKSNLLSLLNQLGPKQVIKPVDVKQNKSGVSCLTNPFDTVEYTMDETVDKGCNKYDILNEVLLPGFADLNLDE